MEKPSYITADKIAHTGCTQMRRATHNSLCYNRLYLRVQQLAPVLEP